MTDPYAPPSAELSNEPASLEVTIPGTSKRIELKHAGLWSGAQLLVDGQPAEKGSWGKKFIPMDDGTQLAVRVQDGLTGLNVVAGKTSYPVGPRIPTWLGVIVFLPVGLVAVGGAIGGALGFGGMFVNKKIAVSQMSMGLKLLSMFGVLLLTVSVTAVLAGLVHNAVNG